METPSSNATHLFHRSYDEAHAQFARLAAGIPACVACGAQRCGQFSGNETPICLACLRREYEGAGLPMEEFVAFARMSRIGAES